MRQLFVCFSLVIALLFVGCSGSDSDLKMSADEIRQSAAKMSTADLQKRMTELEERSAEMAKRVGQTASAEQNTELTKLMEVSSIYTAELVKRKAK